MNLPGEYVAARGVLLDALVALTDHLRRSSWWERKRYICTPGPANSPNLQ